MIDKTKKPFTYRNVVLVRSLLLALETDAPWDVDYLIHYAKQYAIGILPDVTKYEFSLVLNSDLRSLLLVPEEKD